MLNNSVIFGGIPMGSEEFLIQMFETLGITVDRCPKGRACKNGKINHKKIRCIPILIYKVLAFL